MTASYYISNYLLKPVLKFYLRFNTVVRFDNLKVKVYKNIFHPSLFFSTKYLYSFLSKINLQSKSFLEIGSGSGVLSLLAYQKGANVTALDIDENAVNNTIENFENNFGIHHKAQILQSDLFEKINPQIFDVILINPPYFFESVQHTSQLAWYCGENGEYFKNLFINLSRYIDKDTLVIMILADNCEIERIKNIASQNNFYFNLLEHKKIKWEINYIYQIQVNSN